MTKFFSKIVTKNKSPNFSLLFVLTDPKLDYSFLNLSLYLTNTLIIEKNIKFMIM